MWVTARLLESLVTGYQKEDGGFAYRRDREQTGSMTTSGITILTLALARVPESKLRFKSARRAAQKALDRAWTYLDSRFTAEANPRFFGFAMSFTLGNPRTCSTVSSEDALSTTTT